MVSLVPTEDIERIVGVRRHDDEHWARAVSAEQKVYILHSRKCLDSGRDLRECPFSLALDNGILLADWLEDEALPVVIDDVRGAPLLAPRVHPAAPSLGGQP